MSTVDLRPLLWITGAIVLALALTLYLTRSDDPVQETPRAATASVDGRLRLLQVERVVAQAGAGSDFLFTATAVRDGKERGTLRGVCTRLGPKQSQCNVTVALKGGTIDLDNLIYQNPKGTGAIIGGTGRFQNVAGIVTSQRLNDKGVQLTLSFN